MNNSPPARPPRRFAALALLTVPLLAACSNERAGDPDAPAQAEEAITPQWVTTNAKCDGTTDDRAAIQAALNQAAAIGTASAPAWVLLPAGVCVVSIASSGDALTLPGANIGLVGASSSGAPATTLRLAPHQGPYGALLRGDAAPSGFSLDLSNLTVRQIAFDANAANNPISLAEVAHWRAATCGANDDCRYGIFVQAKSNNIAISSNTFQGFDDVETVVVNAVNGVAVDGNIFGGMGAGPYVNGGVPDTNTADTAHDHSTIYVTANQLEIAGNTFSGRGPSAITAIETHGPIWQAASDDYQSVHDNVLTGYANGINVGGASLHVTRHVHVTGNLMIGVKTGIDVWSSLVNQETMQSWLAANLQRPYGLEDIWITGNHIYPLPELWALPGLSPGVAGVTTFGIALNPGSDLGVNGLHLNGNTIDYGRSRGYVPTASDVLSAGISLYRAAAYGAECVSPTICDDRDVEVASNYVNHPVTEGVLVFLQDARVSASGVLPSGAGLSIVSNWIVDPGTGYTLTTIDAIDLFTQSQSGTLQYPVIANNTIIDNRQAGDTHDGRVGYGIDASGVSSLVPGLPGAPAAANVYGNQELYQPGPAPSNCFFEQPYGMPRFVVASVGSANADTLNGVAVGTCN